MIGLATVHLAEVLADERISNAAARRPHAEAARRRHKRQRRAGGLTLLLENRRWDR
jgi:hypothetical protein